MASVIGSGSLHQELIDQASELSRRFNYQEHGFAITPEPLLSANEVALVREHAEAVLNGVYETGIAPRTNSGGADVANHPKYIEAQMPQDADNVIADILRSPRIAEWAAKVSGGRRLKVWNAQVMKKYPSDDGASTIVGWHQDRHYLDKIMTGTAFNLWIALDDVFKESGPVCYVPRSHAWGHKYSTGFFDRDHENQRRQFSVPEGEAWEEVCAVLPAGWGVSHHADTLHASSGNTSAKSRLNILVNIGVDDFEIRPESYFAARVDDERATPVIYKADI